MRFRSRCFGAPSISDGLYGAARAAEILGDSSKARRYYERLVSVCDPETSRPEPTQAREYLAATRGAAKRPRGL